MSIDFINLAFASGILGFIVFWFAGAIWNQLRTSKTSWPFSRVMFALVGAGGIGVLWAGSAMRFTQNPWIVLGLGTLVGAMVAMVVLVEDPQ